MPLKKTRRSRRKAKAKARKTRRKQKGGWWTCGSKGCVTEPIPRVAAAAPPPLFVTPAPVEEDDGTEPVSAHSPENNSIVPLKKPANNASNENLLARNVKFSENAEERVIVPRGVSKKTGPLPSLTKRLLSSNELARKKMAYPYSNELPYLPQY